MKKLLIATLEFPPMRGGVAEYLYGLAHALPRDKVAVLADASSGEPPPAMFTVRTAALVGQRNHVLSWLGAVRKVAAALAAEKAEMLAVSHLLPMGYVALILRRLRGVPYVVIVHGTDLRFAARTPWKRFWARRVLQSAALVVANSRYTAGLAERAGADPARLEIVYPCPAVGHSVLEEEPEAKQGMGVAGQRRMMLSVGRLVRRKGFDRAIRALSSLRRACGDVVYVIVGVGPERQALEREAARNGVKPSVIFREGVDHAKLRELFGAADVFVMPGREDGGDVEGFGIALLEAAFHGLPTVTTDVGGAAEAVVDGETGAVLSADVSDAKLAEVICRLLVDRNLARRLGAAGRRRVRAEFTWPVQSAKLKKRLETL